MICAYVVIAGVVYALTWAIEVAREWLEALA